MTTIETDGRTVWVIFVLFIFYSAFSVLAPFFQNSAIIIIVPSIGILVCTLNVLFTDVFTGKIMSGIFAGLSLPSIFFSVMISVFFLLSGFDGFANLPPITFEDQYRLNRFIHLLNILTLILLSLYAFSDIEGRLRRIGVSLSTRDERPSEEQITSTSDGDAGPPPTPSLTSEEQTTSDTQTSGVETERSPNTISGSNEEPDPHTVEITEEYP